VANRANILAHDQDKRSACQRLGVNHAVHVTTSTV
jgi:hypothetical protein